MLLRHRHDASAMAKHYTNAMSLILFNKPFQVMCQFSAHPGRPTLADYIKIPDIYPAGRLDADSEGLLLLTDDGKLQHNISHPALKQPKTYMVQVDGVPTLAMLARLRQGVDLGDFHSKPCQAREIEAPDWLWPRDPPIRQRQDQPTSWLALTLTEGKNRQVRRMTAAVGLPTLRLVRVSIGQVSLHSHPLWPGESMEISPADLTDLKE
ncbi:23S rRNA pseudouridine2457 synthase [Collimonas sp. OK242]|jgi:23S rRNA pseudouridine2457 synthase|nr:23S rRNA pseudouridine2457 synthase [Collimonas sp. OK242]